MLLCHTMRIGYRTDCFGGDRVGTVLKIVDIAKQEGEGQLIRIVVTCQPQKVVEICSIENPTAASYDQRLRRSPGYLEARVCDHRNHKRTR